MEYVFNSANCLGIQFCSQLQYKTKHTYNQWSHFKVIHIKQKSLLLGLKSPLTLSIREIPIGHQGVSAYRQSLQIYQTTMMLPHRHPVFEQPEHMWSTKRNRCIHRFSFFFITLTIVANPVVLLLFYFLFLLVWWVNINY